VRGPLRAAEAKRAAGATAAIGFAVVPGPEPDANGFWAGIGNLGGSDFAAEADYAGIDMYPDVFGPPTGIDGLPCGAVGVADLPQADAAASGCRRERMPPLAGIGPATPVRVCENGWPAPDGQRKPRHRPSRPSYGRSVSCVRIWTPRTNSIPAEFQEPD
jgi:hypothetical protein